MHALRTTTISVDSLKSDWVKVDQAGRFMKYKLPFRPKWDHLHNWYLRNSEYPYYLNTGAGFLYVLYPSEDSISQLKYDGRILPQQTFHPTDEALHTVMKLVLSAMFGQHRIFVSNRDFYLLFSTSAKGFATVLSVNLSEITPGKFSLRDQATTLYPLKEIPKANPYGKYYTADERFGFTLLRRIHPEEITRIFGQRPIFFKPKSMKGKRTQARYLSIASLESLRKSRSYILWRFVNHYTNFLQQAGFNAEQMMYPYVDARQNKRVGKHESMSLSHKTVFVVDDRIRPKQYLSQEPNGFEAKLFDQVSNVTKSKGLQEDKSQWAPQLKLISPERIAAESWILRLQDNLGEDCQPATTVDDEGNEYEISPPLLPHPDPYKTFYEQYASTAVIQSLNVNRLGGNDQDDLEDEQNSGDKPIDSAESYMGYPLPSSRFLEVRLLNSFYQLQLKDVVKHPQEAASRFAPLLNMNDNIFVTKKTLAYKEGNSLIFMSLQNNLEAMALLKAKTGHDLIKDILQPAFHHHYPYKNDISAETRAKILKNSRFIINKEYVLEIIDSPERVLYDIEQIEQRLNLELQKRPKGDFLPTFSEAEKAVFADENALTNLASFLQDPRVEDPLSFRDFTTRYSGHEELPNLYEILEGKRKNDKTKQFKKYLHALWGVEIKSPKGTDVTRGYQGISYLPNTQQYYVGDKHGFPENKKQDRGFVLRDIVVHRGNPDKLDDYLEENFFPLLEVDFVRYQRYTVYPFPFKLIDMWLDVRKYERTT